VNGETLWDRYSAERVRLRRELEAQGCKGPEIQERLRPINPVAMGRRMGELILHSEEAPEDSRWPVVTPDALSEG
jgi:hypothetical protein